MPWSLVQLTRSLRVGCLRMAAVEMQGGLGDGRGESEHQAYLKRANELAHVAVHIASNELSRALQVCQRAQTQAKGIATRDARKGDAWPACARPGAADAGSDAPRLAAAWAMYSEYAHLRI